MGDRSGSRSGIVAGRGSACQEILQWKERPYASLPTHLSPLCQRLPQDLPPLEGAAGASGSGAAGKEGISPVLSRSLLCHDSPVPGPWGCGTYPIKSRASVSYTGPASVSGLRRFLPSAVRLPGRVRTSPFCLQRLCREAVGVYVRQHRDSSLSVPRNPHALLRDSRSSTPCQRYPGCCRIKALAFTRAAHAMKIYGIVP